MSEEYVRFGNAQILPQDYLEDRIVTPIGIDALEDTMQKGRSSR